MLVLVKQDENTVENESRQEHSVYHRQQPDSSVVEEANSLCQIRGSRTRERGSSYIQYDVLVSGKRSPPLAPSTYISLSSNHARCQTGELRGTGVHCSSALKYCFLRGRTFLEPRRPGLVTNSILPHGEPRRNRSASGVIR